MRKVYKGNITKLSMALDDLLSGLSTTTKEGEIKPNSNYDAKNLVGVYDALIELGSIDISSTEGLRKYGEMTGEDLSKCSLERAYLRRKSKVTGVNEILFSYFDVHFNSLVGEIGEEERRALALEYSPETDLPGESNKDYNSARQIVSKSKETLERIKKDANAYFKEELKKETPLMAHFMLRFSNEFIQIEQREAREDATFAIAKYGADKYLTTTKTHLSQRNEEHSGKQKELEAKIKEKTDELQTSAGRRLGSTELAPALSDEFSQLRKLSEDYKETEMLAPLIKTTADYAISTIKQKAEEKKKTEEEIITEDSKP